MKLMTIGASHCLTDCWIFGIIPEKLTRRIDSETRNDGSCIVVLNDLLRRGSVREVKDSILLDSSKRRRNGLRMSGIRSAVHIADLRFENERTDPSSQISNENGVRLDAGSRATSGSPLERSYV